MDRAKDNLDRQHLNLQAEDLIVSHVSSKIKNVALLGRWTARWHRHVRSHELHIGLYERSNTFSLGISHMV